jgi:glycosyltransferase involved in cell wall biosynthesis
MTQSDDKQIDFSVVIAAWNGVSLLRDCLLSLEKQIETGGTEVIVVSNFETGVSESKKQFPFAKHIVLSEKTTVPKLRARGILEARGEIVALLEDFCTFDCKWREEIEKAHEKPYSIVGGAVENFSGATALDWAVYFYDYGKYMPPVTSGVTDTLSGMNVSYKREVLDSLRENYENGFFEFFIHEELKRRGHELYLTQSAVIFHRKNYNLKRISVQFHHQARSFAARRVNCFPLSKRFSFLLASLTLPILLPARILSRTINKKRHFKELIKSVPFLMILMSVWAYGEFCGYLSGEGNSGKEWK